VIFDEINLFREQRSLVTQLFRQIGDRVISLAAIAEYYGSLQ
jgi:hypothetical protein